MDLTMNDFVVTVIQFVCLYYITKLFVNGMLILMEGKRQAKLADITHLDSISHRVKVEQHGDYYYWYDVDDGEFLAQGKDMTTILDVVKSRFPKHIFFVTTPNTIYKIHAPDWTLDPMDIKNFG